MTKMRIVVGAGCLACVMAAAGTTAQSPDAAAHRAAAVTAAGQDHPGLLAALCPATPPPPRADTAGRGQAGSGAARGAAPPRGVPERSTWHAEPVKVFDNLYWFGQTEFSVWAVTTSQGIIVLDTIFDYSVQDEVVDGMRKMGLDPTQIKYAIVSHGHGDHSGGAKLLQDEYQTHVLLSEADWALLDRSSGTRPKRDMVITDGMKLTLGDTTLTMYITPGHTDGTVSTIIPVKDRGVPHVIGEWGGTLIGGLRTAAGLQTYIDSAARFKDILRQAGAEGILSNHTNYDNSKVKLPLVLKRGANDPNPYLIGPDATLRYMTVAEECARAAQAALPR